VNDSLKTGQPNGDAGEMPQMNIEEVRMFDIPDERRAALDLLIDQQFDIDSMSGIKTAKRVWARFKVDALQFVGWTREKDSIEFVRTTPRKELDYLNIAFSSIWAGLSPAGRKVAEDDEIWAQRQAAQHEAERLRSIGAVDFLMEDSSGSAKCQLAYIRLDEWRADQNPGTLQCARQLFQEAADAGNFESLFSLGYIAVFPPGAKYMSPPPSPIYLVADERLRRDYIERAATAGYKEAIDFLDREGGDDVPDGLEEWIDAERERAEQPYWRQQEIREVPNYRAKAAKGDLDTIVHLADLLIKSADDIRQRWPADSEIEIAKQFGFESKEVDPIDVQTVAAYMTEARELLDQAEKTGDPRALWLLASTEDFGLEEDRKLELLQKAAFPTNDNFKPSLIAVDVLARARYEAGEFDEAERCLRLLIAHRRSPSDFELRLAELYKKTGEFTKAEQALRDHIRNRKTPDRAELDLARLICSHLSEMGARNAEVLELLESSAAVDAEAAMLTGLMRLRGQGCESNRDLAKKHFDRCKAIRKLPGSAGLVSPAADYVDLALSLGWGGDSSLYAATEELFKLADNCNFKGSMFISPELCDVYGRTNTAINQLGGKEAIQFDALQFSINDADTLQKGNAAFTQIDESKSLRPEFGQVTKPSNLLLGSLSTAVLSEMKFDESGVLVEYALTVPDIDQWIPKNSMVWSFFIGQLILAGRIEAAMYSDAIASFEKVNLLEEQIRQKERDGKPDHTGYKRLRRWLHEKTQIALSRARQLRTAEEKEAEHDRETQRKADEDRRIEQAKRESVESMMALFAHKFRGPVDSILFNTTHQHDERIYVDAAHTMNGLLDIFSVVSTTPEKLATSLKDDVGGNGSPASVLLHSLKLALVQLLSTRNRLRLSPHYLAYAKRQGQAPAELRQTEWMREKRWVDKEIELQTKWEQEIGTMTIGKDIRDVGAWMASHLLPIRVEGFSESTARFAEYGPKASLLTVIFTEVLVNAIKHAAPTAILPLVASWSELSEEVSFTFANPSTRDSRDREKSKGSGKGHKFLKLIAENIGGSFGADITNDRSWVSMKIPGNLMTGVIL